MNGYEFTKFESNFTNKVKAKTSDLNNYFHVYEASIVAMQASHAFEIHGIDFKETDDYKDAMFWYYETTQSCNKKEAINWAKYYMMNAIAYGIETKNLDWRTKFLAAWDMFNELTNGCYTSTISDQALKFNHDAYNGRR